MDFVSLATATSARKLILRRLGSSEDDDFARIDGPATHDGAPGATAVTDSDSSPSEMTAMSGDQPIISPAAEAELFMLASNFLLCKCTHTDI